MRSTASKQRCIVGSLLSIIFFLHGCTSTSPRYPEDHARLERIVEAVNKLREAYVTRDAQAFDALLLPLDSVRAWAKTVHKDFEVYSDIALEMTIERIEIHDDLIMTFVVWHGQWKPATSQRSVRARGHGILYWSGSRVILLHGVEGDLPFGMADREGLA